MNLKSAATFFLILAGLVTLSGCFGSSGPAPAATVPTPETLTPITTTVTLVTRLPDNEVARITVDHFGLDPSNEDVYEFIGKVQVAGGPYQSVKVILRYPDAQQYAYDAGGMGGSNQTLKPFYLYPENRYIGTNPEKILDLDGKLYATTYRYESGILAWVATRESLIPS